MGRLVRLICLIVILFLLSSTMYQLFCLLHSKMDATFKNAIFTFELALLVWLVYQLSVFITNCNTNNRQRRIIYAACQVSLFLTASCIFLGFAITAYIIYPLYFLHFGVACVIAATSLAIMAVMVNDKRGPGENTVINLEAQRLLRDSEAAILGDQGLDNKSHISDRTDYDDLYDLPTDYCQIANTRNAELLYAARIVGDETWEKVKESVEEILGGSLDPKRKRIVSFAVPETREEKVLEDESDDSFASLERALQRLDSHISDIRERLSFD